MFGQSHHVFGLEPETSTGFWYGRICTMRIISYHISCTGMRCVNSMCIYDIHIYDIYYIYICVCVCVYVTQRASARWIVMCMYPARSFDLHHGCTHIHTLDLQCAECRLRALDGD